MFESTSTPTWAAVSANGLATVQPPPGVKRIELWADRDESGTGQAAAEKAAARLYGEGFDVVVLLPPQVGRDWLDVLVSDGAEALKQAQRDAVPWQPPAADDASEDSTTNEDSTTTPDAGPNKRSAADRLVDLGRSRYRLGLSTEGEPFGEPLNGPRIARLLRGQGGSLRADLAAGYLDQYGKAGRARPLLPTPCLCLKDWHSVPSGHRSTCASLGTTAWCGWTWATRTDARCA